MRLDSLEQTEKLVFNRFASRFYEVGLIETWFYIEAFWLIAIICKLLFVQYTTPSNVCTIVISNGAEQFYFIIFAVCPVTNTNMSQNNVWVIWNNKVHRKCHIPLCMLYIVPNSTPSNFIIMYKASTKNIVRFKVLPAVKHNGLSLCKLNLEKHFLLKFWHTFVCRVVCVCQFSPNLIFHLT